MHPYPHTYSVTAAAAATGLVSVASADVAALSSAPPPQFDGPGGYWSPETLLCAALADCFVLTFRAIARASKLEWIALDCAVDGVLERIDGTSRFTRFVTRASLRVPAGVDRARAQQLLEKAEHGCLIANSVTGVREIRSEVLEG